MRGGCLFQDSTCGEKNFKFEDAKFRHAYRDTGHFVATGHVRGKRALTRITLMRIAFFFLCLDVWMHSWLGACIDVGVCHDWVCHGRGRV